MNKADKIKKAVNNVNLNRFRLIFQVIAFGLLVYGGYLGVDLGNKLPTFSCVYDTSGRGGVCFLGTFQYSLNKTWQTLMGFTGIMFLVSFVTFVLWFLVFNKAWCGYICPLGTMQDWVTKLRQRLKVDYSGYTWVVRDKLKQIKWILLVLLILLPLGISNSLAGLPKFSPDMSMPFCKICPARILVPLFTGNINQFYIDFSSKTAIVMTALGMTVLGISLAGSFVKKRFFCLFCPMSALHYIFSKMALLKLQKDGSKCTRCGDCYRACDMEIREIADDVESKNIVKEDCMMCFKCVAACPEKDALEVRFLNLPIFTSTEEGFLKRQGIRKENHDE